METPTNKKSYRYKDCDRVFDPLASSQECIECADLSLSEDDRRLPLPLEKEFYTPEEAYELLMSEIESIYDLKDAV